jgi:hypothetical protein
MVLYSKFNIKNIVCNIRTQNRCVQRNEEIDIVLCTLFVTHVMAILCKRLSCWFLEENRCRLEKNRWYEAREVKWSCTVKGAIWCLRNDIAAGVRATAEGLLCATQCWTLETTPWRRCFQWKFFGNRLLVSYRKLILKSENKAGFQFCFVFHPMDVRSFPNGCQWLQC